MTDRLSFYAKRIREISNCTEREAQLIEEIMREHLFHSTLDWLHPDQFCTGVNEAFAILKSFRAADEVPDVWQRFLSGEDGVI